jgi:uncharacterized membrane protein
MTKMEAAMNWKKRLLLGAIGGMGYVGLELVWRGRSHWSMFLAGGACFLLIGHLKELPKPARLPFQILWSAGIITMVELAAGLLVNRSYAVWDYRSMPGNFLGQICLPYCFLWLPVSLLAMKAYRYFSRKLKYIAA